MIRQELKKIERNLPEKYISFIENYPEKLLDAGDVSTCEFLQSPEDIESVNIEIRAVEKIAEENYFCIGVSGCGDYYLIDLDEEDPEVIFWNHEIDEFDKSEGFPSLEIFASKLIKMRIELQQYLVKSKPWWKFW